MILITGSGKTNHILPEFQKFIALRKLAIDIEHEFAVDQEINILITEGYTGVRLKGVLIKTTNQYLIEYSNILLY